MKKEDLKYIIMGIIFIGIIVLIIKFIMWLLPYALVLFGAYLVYVLVIKVKDRTIELNKKDKKKKNDNIKEAEIVKEKNEE
jgi:predicted DNA repair protein MutK